MIDFYVIQIRLGKITIEDVPEKLQDAVDMEIRKQEESAKLYM